MEKKYQIFISSTFTDLQDERQAVLKAILELGHMPAGMELFPATDDTAWQLIKDVIDSSDYYTLIIAGRYGSVDEKGIGYTEKEYDYAVGSKKPVIPLLHNNTDEIPRGKTETDKKAWDKLMKFRKKVEKNHTCVYWSSVEELKSKLIVGLTSIVKRHPAIGWVRSDLIPNDATLSELLKLRNKVQTLEEEAFESSTKPPIGTEGLSQGEDTFEISCSFDSHEDTESYPFYKDTSHSGKLHLTWNQIFAAIAPRLINEASNEILRYSIRIFFEKLCEKYFAEDNKSENTSLTNFKFSNVEIDTCIVQLRALGLMKESKTRKSLKDKATYWTLTPYGDTKMVQLRALRKIPLDNSTTNRVDIETTTNS